MGGGKGAPLSQTPPPPPIFSPLTPVRGTVIPRDAKRRAEPPSYTSVSAGTQTPPYRREAASGTSILHQCVCGDADTSIQTRSGERNLH